MSTNIRPVLKNRMRASERKAAIVNAALPLFARQGYAAATTKALARAAGVSEPLLYKHFPSKEALFLAIQNLGCLADNPVTRRLEELEPSASTLVHLVYWLMRAMVIGKPVGAIDWDTRHRLMLNSLLEDGEFARLTYRNRINCFCARMTASLSQAIRRGEAVKTSVSPNNAALFVYHVGVWIAVVNLPDRPAIDYKTGREELVRQAVCFALRGMGLTDKAIAAHFNPKALAIFFPD